MGNKPLRDHLDRPQNAAREGRNEENDMEPATNQAKAAQAEEALEAAIKHHESISEGMPGSWSVETSEGSVMLVWSCDADDEAVSGMQSDEPFTAWGGDAIIADAGMRDPDESGCDSYHDQYGDELVSQWVEWNL